MVNWNLAQPLLVGQFQNTLEHATDERPLQAFFEKHPEVLLTGVVRPHNGWVIPRPKFAPPNHDPLVPDFVICEWSSVGPDWYIVELENPRKGPLKSNGDISQICNHAANQINTYRRFIEEHGHFLRGHGWPKLHREAEGIIVIGRRNDPLRAKFPDSLQEFKRQRIDVVSYDRLLEKFRAFQAALSTQRRVPPMK